MSGKPLGGVDPQGAQTGRRRRQPIAAIVKRLTGSDIDTTLEKMISNRTYPIGIAIGDRSVTAVQLKQDGRRPAVRAAVRHTIQGDPSEKKARLRAALRAIRRDRRFRGRKAVLHLPADVTTGFAVNLALDKDEPLEAAIVRESRRHLSFGIEEAVIDYPSMAQVPGDPPGRYRGFVVAARKDDVRAFMGLSAGAGLRVEAIDVEVASLMRLHEAVIGAGGGHALVGHVGRTRTLLIVSDDGGVRAQRRLAWGLEPLLDKIAKGFELQHGPQQTESLLRTCGLSFENDQAPEAENPSVPLDIRRALYRILAPAADELVYELHKMIAYLRAENRIPEIDGIYLYGGASLVLNLDAYLTSRLGVAARLVNPLSAGAIGGGVIADEGWSASYAMALGLAMRTVPWL